MTDAKCRTAKAKESPYKLSDEKGLYLYVTPAGYKSWRMKYRFAKKEKRITFGPYPEVSLSSARDLRDAARRLIRDGIDPSVEKKQRTATRFAEAENSFDSLARRWHENQKPTWTPKHAKAVLDSLETEVFPTLGKTPIKAITAPMVLEIARTIENRGAIETAHRIRYRMSAVFVFAIAEGVADNDPAAVVQKALKPIKKGKQPALRTVDQARALLKASENAPAHPITKLASRLLAITAVRPGVLRLAAPTEFEGLDTAEPLWRIPAEKMKLVLAEKEDETFEFVVPLPTQAVAVVRAAQELIGRGPCLFPNTRHAHRPLSENAIGYMYNRLPEFRGRHVPHGWRSTFSTVMNERAERLERPGDRAIIDLMLAHRPPGVEGIYNRAAYMPRRREIAQEWADMLLAGLPPASELLSGKRK